MGQLIARMLNSGKDKALEPAIVEHFIETETGKLFVNLLVVNLTFLEDKVSELISDLPDEIWLRIFQNVSRSDLDRCMRVCRKWNRVIEGRSKQLTQRRVLNLSYCGDRYDTYRMKYHFLESYSNYRNDCFWMEVTSESGKKLRIEEDSNRQTPEFRVFKNSIVDRLRESNFVAPVIFREVRGQNSSNHGPIELVEQRLKKIVELAGDRIPVRCFQFNGYVCSLGFSVNCLLFLVGAKQRLLANSHVSTISFQVGNYR
jgi:hypothetical protein